MNILINIFLLFLLYNNLIFNTISFPEYFGYWDELLEVGIFIWTAIAILHSKKKTISVRHLIIAASLVAVVLIGLCGNVIFGYVSSVNGIVRDVVNFLKFPMVFLLIQRLKLDLKIAKFINRGTINFLKILITIIFLLGIISIFKDIGLSQDEIRYAVKPYQFLFSHPTYLVLNNICILSLIDAVEDSKRKWPFEIMLILTIVMTMRTKGIAVVAVYIFIRYAGNWLKRFKILYWGFAGGIAFFMAYDKLVLYNSYASSPREALYKGSIQLLLQCFPFGSGFSTFASHLSNRFNSLVYKFIKIPFYWTANGTEKNVLGDAGLAYYIGQFGLLGIILCVIIFYQIYKISMNHVKRGSGISILYIYIIIALTTESILINNGLEIAFIITLVSFLSKEEIHLSKGNYTVNRKGRHL